MYPSPPSSRHAWHAAAPARPQPLSRRPSVFCLRSVWRQVAPTHSFAAARPVVLSMTKLLTVGLINLPFLRAHPLNERWPSVSVIQPDGKPSSDPTLWIYLSTAVFLVLLGGAFAGLTIALMGQDEVNLQVIQASGDGREKVNAEKVLRLLSRGKHWVLVTLLLGNVITNETLPIVLDRSLGGGWPAVLSSTVLIVIFGEIIPQSICVRYGLPIGAWMSPLVLVLMYILSPVAWPTAKLLDKVLGEEKGTVYKKAGLKTLVDLHKTLGASPHERLNQDEVTIISAVLDLKAKSVGSIMTPIGDVFTMSSDTVLDENAMDVILSAGYSRIPIHEPGNKQNFLGMLLVKILITYDPEDARQVSEFALATLPETRPETSCLDIVNFFQEGKSHMVLVSEYPGEDHGVLGVVTLEDVIEELIGEEIIDESDVFVDVHKAIRRLAPAPKARPPKGQKISRHSSHALSTSDGAETTSYIDRSDNDDVLSRTVSRGAEGVEDFQAVLSASPKGTLTLRKPEFLVDPSSGQQTFVRGSSPVLREHFKHLGPSNLASRPKTTKFNTVKIKPGGGPDESGGKRSQVREADGVDNSFTLVSHAPQGGVGEGLLRSAGTEAKDGVLSLQAGYGSFGTTSKADETSQCDSRTSQKGESQAGSPAEPKKRWSWRGRSRGDQSSNAGSKDPRQAGKSSSRSRSPDPSGIVKSGSIMENVIQAGGIRKVVLEATSGSSDEENLANQDRGNSSGDHGLWNSANPKSPSASSQPLLSPPLAGEGAASVADQKSPESKKSSSRRKRRKRHDKKAGGGNSEETPLLKGDS